MGPRIWVDRSKLHWLRLDCVARKKKTKHLERVGFRGREREEGAPG